MHTVNRLHLGAGNLGSAGTDCGRSDQPGFQATGYSGMRPGWVGSTVRREGQ